MPLAVLWPSCTYFPVSHFDLPVHIFPFLLNTRTQLSVSWHSLTLFFYYYLYYYFCFGGFFDFFLCIVHIISLLLSHYHYFLSTGCQLISASFPQHQLILVYLFSLLKQEIRKETWLGYQNKTIPRNFVLKVDSFIYLIYFVFVLFFY